MKIRKGHFSVATFMVTVVAAAVLLTIYFPPHHRIGQTALWDQGPVWHDQIFGHNGHIPDVDLYLGFKTNGTIGMMAYQYPDGTLVVLVLEPGTDRWQVDRGDSHYIREFTRDQRLDLDDVSVYVRHINDAVLNKEKDTDETIIEATVALAAGRTKSNHWPDEWNWRGPFPKLPDHYAFPKIKTQPTKPFGVRSADFVYRQFLV